MKKQYRHIVRINLILICFWAMGNCLLWGQSDPLTAWILYHEAEASSSSESALSFAEEALRVGEKSKDEQLKLNAHLLLGRIWFQKEKLPLSLRHYLQVQNLAKKPGLTLSRPQLQWEMANLYEAWEVHDKAFDSFRLILDESSALEKRDWELRALAGMARNKEAAKNIEEALSYYEELRNKFKIREDKTAELAILRSIIRLQKESRAFQKALASNEEALKVNRQAKDTAEIIISLNNIGVLYRQLERYEESLTYFIQASEMEELFQKTKASNPITLSNIGILYQNLDDYPNSLKYLKRAELQTQLEREVDSSLLSNIKNLLAIIYLNSNESTNAYFYNGEAIEIAKKIEKPALLELYYKTRSNIEEQVGAFEEALQYYRMHTHLLDSLSKDQQAQREEDLQKRFSAEQTEKEMSLLLVDKEIAELKLRQDELENEKLRQENSLKEQQLKIAQQEIERQEAEQVLLNTQNQLLSEQKDRQITLLEKEQSEAELILTEERLKREQQDRAIAQAQREQAEADLALQEKDFQLQNQKQNIIRNTIIAGLITSLLVLILLIRTARLRRRATLILSNQKQELEETLHTLKKTQTQLIQAEKMASLGALTAG
ncbi:MAG: tetratricopeptide repeat protein, partial [Bacteroidota bacterium]